VGGKQMDLKWDRAVGKGDYGWKGGIELKHDAIPISVQMGFWTRVGGRRKEVLENDRHNCRH
jgi:hypothetical protein